MRHAYIMGNSRGGGRLGVFLVQLYLPKEGRVCWSGVNEGERREDLYFCSEQVRTLFIK